MLDLCDLPPCPLAQLFVGYNLQVQVVEALLPFELLYHQVDTQEEKRTILFIEHALVPPNYLPIRVCTPDLVGMDYELVGDSDNSPIWV